MTLNRLVLPLAILSGLISACTPYQQTPNPGPQDPNALGADPTVTSPEQKQLADAREKANRESNQDPNLNGGDPTPTPPPDPGAKKDFPQGIQIPGKDGFVFNPYNNNPVDVRGIPPGTLVRDPQDPNPDHKFRVP